MCSSDGVIHNFTLKITFYVHMLQAHENNIRVLTISLFVQFILVYDISIFRCNRPGGDMTMPNLVSTHSLVQSVWCEQGSRVTQVEQSLCDADEVR